MSKTIQIFFIFFLSLLVCVNSQCATNAGNSSGACLCNQGYYGATPTTTTASCTQCPTGSTTATPSSSAGGNSSSSADVSTCNVCLKGYYMTTAAAASSGSTAATGATCVACPANSTTSSTSTSVSDITSCLCYDSNAALLSSSVTTCVCKNGYGGTVASTSGATSGCTPCPAGQFQSGTSTCANCAAGSAISSDQSSCTCYDSSVGTLPWSSTTNVCQCQANFYGNPSSAVKTTTTSGSCTKCPNGTISAVGAAKTSSDCASAGATITYSSIPTIYSFVTFLSAAITIIFCSI